MSYDTVITPTGYAFAIWAPIFASCIVSAIRQRGTEGRTHPGEPEHGMASGRRFRDGHERASSHSLPPPRLCPTRVTPRVMAYLEHPHALALSGRPGHGVPKIMAPFYWNDPTAAGDWRSQLAHIATPRGCP